MSRKLDQPPNGLEGGVFEGAPPQAKRRFAAARSTRVEGARKGARAVAVFDCIS